jgi:serine protease Do
VVSIEAKMQAKKAEPRRQRPENFDRLPKEFQQYWEEQERKRAQMPPDESVGFGSGMVVDPSGIILTSYHVVEGADQVEVQLTDGRKFTSQQIIVDKKTDVAVVRILAKRPLPYLEFGDSDAMEIGDRVLALGAPFGLTGSVTSGIISAKGRSLRLNMYEDFLQTDAAINPGNSGGPLVNLEGKIIGINSAIKSRSGGFQGVGLAIASNLAKSVMQQLLKGGTFRHGYLGVQIKDLDPDTMAELGLQQPAVVTRTVFPNSPASKGGLKVGDVIVSIAGRPARDVSAVQKTVAASPLNVPTEVIILRGGKYLKINLTIVEQPDDGG